MLNTVLPFLLACNMQAPPTVVNDSHPNLFRWASEHNVQLIAEPIHGDDPHNEKHDSGLPANKHAGDGYPSDDPYNGQTDNNKDSPNKPY